MEDSSNTTGADSARPPRKTPAKAPQGPAETTPASPAVTVVVKAVRNGITIAGARVAKGHPVNVTQAVAEFHEARGEVVIVGTA